MRIAVTAGICLALALLSGCARARITTEVKADGSWARSVLLTAKDEPQGGGMSFAMPLEQTFQFPSGDAWKSHEEKKSGDRTMAFERSLAAGAVLKGDLSIKCEQDGSLCLTNETTVTRVAPQRFEYRETLRWIGPPPDSAKIKPEDLARIKAALPGALATDANARALGERMAKLAIPLLFGPGDPLLVLGVADPDLAERRATQRMGSLVLKALEEQFGDKMAPNVRRETAHRLIETSFRQAMPAAPDPAAGPPTNKGANLTALTFVVKGGKVISSNGELDDWSGEVYWSLYPEAASLGPVTLTAVLQVDQK